MRKGFENLPDISNKHNEIHRRCYKTPYLITFVSSAPTADSLEEREMAYCTADNKLYINVDGTLKSASFS